MEKVVERALLSFNQLFGESPTLARAPGRVNLIGEHTDYNLGFVLPMAIDRAVYIVFRRRLDRRVLLHSLNFTETVSFDLNTLERGSGWIEYVKGVAWALMEHGFTLSGWEGVIAGNVPQGAGLSSSAALELVTARVFASVSALEWQPQVMAFLAQKAENDWVGVQCGIMDQMVSAAGQVGHALLIDCRSLEILPVPLPAGTDVVVMDTGTRRGLVDSEYNERRVQCETAARILGIPSLREMNVEMFIQQSGAMDTITQKRARHVITENERTLLAVKALQAGDSVRMGELMNASHASLRDDYEVSSRELDSIVELALQQPGCFGARMTGAGFGGCAVALVERSHTPPFVANTAAFYKKEVGLDPIFYVCRATAGAELLPYRE